MTPYWMSASTRVLFLLKNTHSKGAFDLRDFLRDGAPKGGTTWAPVARWMAGLQALYANPDDPMPWSHYWPSPNQAQRRQLLRSIAAVNVDKASGGATSSRPTLEAAVARDREFLKEQLALYHPDLLIVCGPDLHGLVRALHPVFQGKRQETSRGVPYFTAAGCTALLYWHPASRGPASLLFYGLLDAVRESTALPPRAMKR